MNQATDEQQDQTIKHHQLNLLMVIGYLNLLTQRNHSLRLLRKKESRINFVP